MKGFLSDRRAAAREGSENGAVLLLTALALVPICLFAALAIDLGNLGQSHEQAVGSTDSAALAGAGYLGSPAYASGALSQGSIVTAVENEVVQNASSAAGLSAGSSLFDTCTAPLPSGWPAWPPDSANHAQDCIAFNASTTQADVVQVAIPPRLVSSFLGQVGGVAGQTVNAVSTAEVVTGPSAAACAVCLLNPTGTALVGNGNAGLTVSSPAGSGGTSSIVVNSASTPAALVNGRGEVQAVNGQIEVVGTARGNGCSPCFSPSPTHLSSPIPDPLAGLPVPSWTSLPIGTANGAPVCNACGSMTITPGLYSSITLNGSGTLTLDPGIYVITGNFTANGSGNVVGNGVLLYFACGSGTTPQGCTSGQSGGSLVLNGNGTANLSPLTSGNCASSCSSSSDFGVTVFYDRNNTSGMTLNGNPSSIFTGTVYGASSQLTLNGNGETENSLIDVGSLVLNGNATVTVSYNPARNAAAGPQDQPELCSLTAGTC